MPTRLEMCDKQSIGAFNRNGQRLAVPAQLGVGSGQADGVMGEATVKSVVSQSHRRHDSH